MVLFVMFYQLRTYRRLRHFKGPPSAAWFEFWHINAIMSLRSHEKYRDVTDKYGSIARIGPNDIITTSPDLLLHMSSVRSAYNRALWYNRASRIEPGRDHIFSTVDDDLHMKRRKQMSPGYSGKENPGLEASVDEMIVEFVQLIRSRYISTTEKSKPMDLARKVQFLTLDVISLIGFGKPFGMLQQDADVDGYIAGFEKVFPSITAACAWGFLPVLQWPPLAKLIGPSEKDRSGVGKLMGTLRRLVDDRLAKPLDGRSDMIAAFTRQGLEREELFTETFLQLIAGSDTTATTIRSVMLYIITHRRVYQKLQSEIDNAVASGLVLRDGGVITKSQAEALPYLNATIREGMRIHPPVTDIVPKVVPAGGDTVLVDGKSVYLPGGTAVGYCVLGLNRRKDLFGDDVEQFRPERWLIDEGPSAPARFDAMKRTTDLIFGHGRYQCLGKPIAWMEMNKAIFELVRNFEWAIACPEKPWVSKNYMGIFLQREMWVTVTERV